MTALWVRRYKHRVIAALAGVVLLVACGAEAQTNEERERLRPACEAATNQVLSVFEKPEGCLVDRDAIRKIATEFGRVKTDVCRERREELDNYVYQVRLARDVRCKSTARVPGSLYVDTPAKLPERRPYTCGATPAAFPPPFGDVLYALTAPCTRALSHQELMFAAGVAELLAERCNYPSSPTQAALYAPLRVAAGVVGTGSNQWGSFPAVVQSVSAYAAGATFAKSIAPADKCGPDAERLFQGYLSYLEATAKDAVYVYTCSGGLSREQCQCIADRARFIIPGIHRESYGGDTSLEVVEKRNPVLGIQMRLECKVR